MTVPVYALKLIAELEAHIKELQMALQEARAVAAGNKDSSDNTAAAMFDHIEGICRRALREESGGRESTTLREILDEGFAGNRWESLFAVHDWAYGQKVECGQCDQGMMRGLSPEDDRPCPNPRCIAGTIREPGLVERVTSILPNSWEGQLAALREELG